MSAPVGMIQPQPVPTTWAYGVAESSSGGPALVCVIIGHAAGNLTAFISPDEADNIADQIRQTAQQARTKRLVTPPGAGQLVSPNGAPLRRVPPAPAPPPEREVDEPEH